MVGFGRFGIVVSLASGREEVWGQVWMAEGFGGKSLGAAVVAVGVAAAAAAVGGGRGCCDANCVASLGGVSRSHRGGSDVEWGWESRLGRAWKSRVKAYVLEEVNLT
jgi:hypothetical protein